MNKEKYELIFNKHCLNDLIPIIKKLNIHVIEMRDFRHNNIIIIILATNDEISELSKNGYFFHISESKNSNSAYKSCETLFCPLCVII